MTETRDLSFLIDSPEYRENAAFVTACYREMLDRDVEAEELFRWCRQLDGVYSRKAVIAALSGSVKFDNRFEIKDIEQYRKRAFIPRAIQHTINKLNTGLGGYDKGCLGPMPRCRIRFGYPKYVKTVHRWTDELDMLSLCRIEALRDQVGQLTERFGPIQSVGVIAGDMVTASLDPSDTVFVTSLDHIVELLNNHDVGLRQFNHLLIPIPVPTKRSIEVIFDENWSARVKGKKPRRWLVGRGAGGILILNNHEYPVTVRLEFSLTILKQGVSVRIIQGQNSAFVGLSKKAVQISLTTILLPGQNRIEFQYIGTAEEAEEIRNIAVSGLVVDGEENSMTCDVQRLGSGYYEAVVPDNRVRNVLHNCGYSEVECIRLYRDNSINREKTTRFLQHDPNSSGDSFYVLRKGAKQNNDSASVRLYIAKKTGDIE